MKIYLIDPENTYTRELSDLSCADMEVSVLTSEQAGNIPTDSLRIDVIFGGGDFSNRAKLTDRLLMWRTHPHTYLVPCWIASDYGVFEPKCLWPRLAIDRFEERIEAGPFCDWLTRVTEWQQSRMQLPSSDELKNHSVLELMTSLALRRANGRLSIFDDEGDEGSFVFHEGCLARASLRHFQGEDAFFELLSWSRGRYLWKTQNPSSSERGNRPLPHLIDEGLSLLRDANVLHHFLPDLKCSIQRTDSDSALDDGGLPYYDMLRQVHSFIDGRITAHELLEVSPLSRPRTMSWMAKWFSLGDIEVAGPPAVAEPFMSEAEPPISLTLTRHEDGMSRESFLAALEDIAFDEVRIELPLAGFTAEPVIAAQEPPQELSFDEPPEVLRQTELLFEPAAQSPLREDAVARQEALIHPRDAVDARQDTVALRQDAVDPEHEAVIPQGEAFVPQEQEIAPREHEDAHGHDDSPPEVAEAVTQAGVEALETDAAAPRDEPAQPHRLLIVDDSRLMCKALQSIFSKDPRFQIVGIANDGFEALRLVEEHQPDVVTMDIHMPGMDGLTALKHIMIRDPRPVVVLSAFTKETSQLTYESFKYGAVNVFSKPSQKGPREMERETELLRDGVSQASCVSMDAAQYIRRGKKNRKPGEDTGDSHAAPGIPDSQRPVVAIGCGAGGFPAFLKMLFALSKTESLPWIITCMAMPRRVVEAMAPNLARDSVVGIEVARAGISLTPGIAYLYSHEDCLHVSADNGLIKLDRDTACREPSHPMDHLYFSTAESFGDRAMALLISGTGSDGAEGMRHMRLKGGQTFALSPDACLNPELPRKLIEKGSAREVKTAARLASLIETCGAASSQGTDTHRLAGLVGSSLRLEPH